ncbi:MAG TPA: FAD-dependent oxidoreductase [Acidimicrobiales bacterium]|nr:FAD-dependent oxidoreductase [Acidimicrobiales bacterium]
MSDAACDVAVAGGGLVGLSLAYELATRGLSVTVIDAAHAGRATDAGAGILSPATNAVADELWWALGSAAGEHYASLVARLSDGGADTAATGYGTCGLLSIGLRESEDPWFDPFARLVQGRPRSAVHEISTTEARALFPPLGPIHRALYNPDACRVDGRGMAAALRHGAGQHGVVLVEGVVSGLVEGGSGSGPRTLAAVHVDGHRDVRCGALAVAGGAWTAAMGEWLDAALPISPTKGQIVHLGVEGDTGRWPILQPLLTHYVVPWPGGRVACGGTFEVGAGFSTTVTAGGLHELLRECLSVAPGLAAAEHLFTRVGLRPTSPDDRPLTGRLPGWSNAWVNTGHGANGLLLGPYTSRLLAEHMVGTAGSDGGGATIGPLDPARFC